jgi:hypothetical protein
MSDYGSEEAKVVEEIPEVAGKKIFISHINSYTGRVLMREMDNKA